MQYRKKKIIEKIVKKNYNNELEEILENKHFEEYVKSTLLSILYKIEASYKDVETVKKDVETKEEYILKILDIIKNDCNTIDIIKMSDEENRLPKNKTYIIDKKTKSIIAYPIDRKLLYAITKIGKKDKIIKDDYFLINETLSDLINVGDNINMVEPLRDFNGYSWTTIPQEIESIDHNLIYQNLRILIGNKFLNKWIKNNEFIIDYYDLFCENLESIYGKENKDKLIDLLSKISILLSIKFNTLKKEELLKTKEKIENQLKEIEDKEKFVENITKDKTKVTREIKKIDKTLSDKELLQKEYLKRNEKLPLESKIFSMRILAQIMEKEREDYIKQLDKLNELQNPKKFVIYQNVLEEKYKYLKLIDTENIEKDIDDTKEKIQKLFLDMIKIRIKNCQTKQSIENLVFELRYYLLLPYRYENNSFASNILNQENLQNKIIEVEKLLIKKAIDLKYIQKFSNNDYTNKKKKKNIFNNRIINLNDSYMKITKEKDKYFIQIFDENIFEEKIEIQKPKDLEIKLNKKTEIMTK